MMLVYLMSPTTRPPCAQLREELSIPAAIWAQALQIGICVLVDAERVGQLANGVAARVPCQSGASEM